MDNPVLIEFLTSLPLHGLLLVAIIVLWRDNRALRDKLDKIYSNTKSNTALLLGQNNEIESIKTQVTGQTPPRGIERPKLSDN